MTDKDIAGSAEAGGVVGILGGHVSEMLCK